jgi:hypothetical protein
MYKISFISQQSMVKTSRRQAKRMGRPYFGLGHTNPGGLRDEGVLHCYTRIAFLGHG